LHISSHSMIFTVSSFVLLSFCATLASRSGSREPWTGKPSIA
jgi:hypothetical protein